MGRKKLSISVFGYLKTKKREKKKKFRWPLSSRGEALLAWPLVEDFFLRLPLVIFVTLQQSWSIQKMTVNVRKRGVRTCGNIFKIYYAPSLFVSFTELNLPLPADPSEGHLWWKEAKKATLYELLKYEANTYTTRKEHIQYNDPPPSSGIIHTLYTGILFMSLLFVCINNKDD